MTIVQQIASILDYFGTSEMYTRISLKKKKQDKGALSNKVRTFFYSIQCIVSRLYHVLNNLPMYKYSLIFNFL